MHAITKRFPHCYLSIWSWNFCFVVYKPAITLCATHCQELWKDSTQLAPPLRSREEASIRIALKIVRRREWHLIFQVSLQLSSASCTPGGGERPKLRDISRKDHALFYLEFNKAVHHLGKSLHWWEWCLLVSTLAVACRVVDGTSIWLLLHIL